MNRRRGDKDVQKTIDGISKQRISFKENENKTNTYTYNRNDTAEVLGKEGLENLTLT